MTWHAYAIETEFDNEVDSMRLFSDWKKDYEKAGSDFAAEQLESEFEDARETARSAGWSGAFQQEARVFTVPDRGVMQFGFCWSEPPLEPDASPLVYVIAPRPLPWLGQPDAILA